MKHVGFSSLALLAVLAGCGTPDRPSEQAGGPPSAAPAMTTTTTVPTPPPVWRAARWGMTKDEVLAAFPGEARRLATPVSFGAPTPGSTDIAIPSFEADGVKFRVLFGFDPNRLSRIHLAATTPADATCADVEKGVTDRHAAPASRNNTGTSLRGEEIVWTRPDQTITLACAGVPSLGFRSVTLVYTPPGTSVGPS